MRRSAMLAAVLMATPWLFTTKAAAQQVPIREGRPDDGIAQEIALVRKDLKSARKQIVASNIVLTDSEAERFWAVYEQFADELVKLSDAKLILVADYLRNHGTLTNAQAEQYLKERAAAEMAAIQLRLKYIPIFRKVLSPKATALFFQVEWRVHLMFELQMASQVPLIETRASVPIKQMQ